MKTWLPLLFSFISLHVHAQRELAQFFPASSPALGLAAKSNAPLLVEGYIAPLAMDMGSLATNGWYTTATTHSPLGFDLTITMNTVFVPDKVKSFTFPNAITGVTFDGTTSGKDRVPTIYGDRNEYPKFSYTSGADNGKSFQGASGIEPGKDLGLKIMALPTLQLGIGLIKNIDLRLRYTPPTTMNNIQSGNWGVGAMHDIRQYIPGLKSLPFSLSVFAGYTRIYGVIDLKGLYAGSQQEGKITGNALTGQIMISKNIKLITLYGALGINQSKTSFAVKGTYTVDKLYPTEQSLTQSFSLTDPSSFDFKKSGVRATGGLRLKLGAALLHGDYTLYNGRGLLTVGLGASFR